MRVESCKKPPRSLVKNSTIQKCPKLYAKHNQEILVIFFKFRDAFYRLSLMSEILPAASQFNTV